MVFMQIICIFTAIYWHVARIARFSGPLDRKLSQRKHVWLFEVSVMKHMHVVSVSERTLEHSGWILLAHY